MAAFCRCLRAVTSPGSVKQSDVKIMIGEMMTVSALLSGFAIGMSTKVTDAQIRSYANFNKAEFFGKGAHICTFDRPTGFVDQPSFLPNPEHVAGGDQCSAEGCWPGHLQTIRVSEELDVPLCSVSAAEAKAQHPEYWADLIEEKIVKVQLELGFNTMFIIMTTVCVVFLGSLLRLSIIKRSDTPKAWMGRFYPLVVLLACLPLVNFYNFLNLASRVVKVIYPYCDDFISGHCLVTGTPSWNSLIDGLGMVFFLVLVLHLSLPDRDAVSVDEVAKANGAPPADIASQLAELAKLMEKGLLSSDEFKRAKGVIMAKADGSTKGVAAAGGLAALV